MKNKAINIFKKEVRELFRDKKSLSMMLIIPILIPVLIIGMSALFDYQVNKDVNSYNDIGFAYKLSAEEKEIAQKLNINVIEGKEEELQNKYNESKIDLYITKENNTYILNSDGSDDSTYAQDLAEAFFDTYKISLQQHVLEDKGIDTNEVLNVITYKVKIVEKDNFFANYIKNYAFLFIIMAITVSATYPATDTTAGEKERGTLETLLTFPIKSKDIIIGKFLGVSISSIITGILSLILAIGALMFVKNTYSIYSNIDVLFSFSSIIFALFVIIAFSFFISGLCIAIASKAKSFKEAQSSLAPITFIAFFPGMIAFLTGVTGSPIVSIIPFLNFTIIFTDITNENVNILNILLVIISTIVYISLVLSFIIKQYKSEKILFSKS